MKGTGVLLQNNKIIVSPNKSGIDGSIFGALHLKKYCKAYGRALHVAKHQ